MDDMGKRTQKWQDSNPLIVWRNAQGLDSQQAAERLGMTPQRLLQLEIGSRPTDEEWKVIIERTGITREQWTRWEQSKPHIGTQPPKE